MLLLALVAFPAASLAGEQFLANGGFEGEYNEQGLAPGWKDNSYSSKGPIEVAYGRETQNPRSGQACQRVTCTRIGFFTEQRTGHAWHGAVQLPALGAVALRKGAVYRVRASVRGDKPTPVEVLLRLKVEPWTRYVTQTVIARADWRDVDYLFTSPVDDPEAVFFIRFEHLGTVWVDAASVEQLTPEQLAQATPPVVPGNLLHNGGFDLGRANWLGERGWDTLHDATFTVEELGGNPCLKATVAAGLKKAVVSDAVPVAPGRPIRASCRVRALQPTEITLGACYQPTGSVPPTAYCSTTQQVGAEWRTVQVDGQIPFRPGTPHALLYLLFTGPGPLWVDDAAIRQDESDAPLPVTRAAIIPDRFPWGLYHDGDPIALRVLASVPPGDKPALDWRLQDYSGTVVRSGRVQAYEGRTQTSVELPDLPRGYYHAFVEWRAGSREGLNESTFCRLPPAERTGDPQTSPFGGHFMYSPLSLAPARAVGMRWVRLWPPGFTLWKTVEAEKGKREWRDAEVQRLADEGFSIVGMLESAPSWAKWGEPSYWEDWERYVADVVEHYRDRIHVWEVQNEPNLSRWWMETPDGSHRAELHVEALQHTYPVVRRADPGATVIGCCTGGDISEGTDPSLFTKEVIQGGGLGAMDALSFHFYHSWAYPVPVDEMPDPISDAVARLKQLMRNAGRELPILNTEGGTQNPAPVITYRPAAADNCDPISGEEVAQLMVRHYIAQWAAGIERFLYYNAFIDGTPAARTWDSFVEGDGQPRPVVAAYAAMTWLLDGATFERTERPSNDVWLHRFSTPRGPLVVAWTRTGTRAEHRFPDAGRAWDLMGADAPIDAGRLVLTPVPAYVLLEDR